MMNTRSPDKAINVQNIKSILYINFIQLRKLWTILLYCSKLCSGSGSGICINFQETTFLK